MRYLKFVTQWSIKDVEEDEVDVVVVGAAGLFICARVVLLTLLAYFSAWTVNSGIAAWFALPPAALNQQFRFPPESRKPSLPLSAYSIVHTRDIFNSIKSPVEIATARVAPNTSQLKLWGTAKYGPGPAFAIIERPDKPGSQTQSLYSEGETILPGVTLAKVDWDHIIIERNGRQETVALSTDASGHKKRPTIIAATRGIRPKDTAVQQLAQDTYQLDRREVEDAMNNLNTLFKQVRAVPYATKDGVPQGFRLFAIKANSLVDRLGIKNGDIVQRVNGVELSDPSTAFSLLHDLQGLSQVQVDVMRNHQPVTLSYEIH